MSLRRLRCVKGNSGLCHIRYRKFAFAVPQTYVYNQNKPRQADATEIKVISRQYVYDVYDVYDLVPITHSKASAR